MKGILEQMSQWESFVDVVNQVAEVIRMQKDILRETEKARDTRTKEIFDDALNSRLSATTQQGFAISIVAFLVVGILGAGMAHNRSTLGS